MSPVARAALLAAAWHAAIAAAAGSHALRAEVRTRWAETPLDAEVAEALAALGPGREQARFWRLVQWSAGHPYAGQRHGAGITDENWAAALLAGAEECLEAERPAPVALGLLRLSLGNREFSPRVQMVRQVAQDAWLSSAAGSAGAAMPCAWAMLGSGEAVGDVGALADAIAAEQPSSESVVSLMQDEHVHPSSWPALGGGAAVPTVVLYGQLFTPELSEFLAELEGRAEEGEIALLLRLSDCGCHAGCAGDAPAVAALGWGVELAVKDSEYVAQDDRATGSGTAAAGAERAELEDEDEEDEDEEVEGLLFQRLVKRRPDLRDQLRELRATLVTEALADGSEGALKAWEMEDLGLQAVKRISTASDQLGALQRLSGNFPPLARTLSKLKLSKTFKRAVTQRSSKLNHLPLNSFALNGQKVGSLGGRFASEGANAFGKRATVATQPFDAFEMLDALRQHARRLDGLAALGVQPEVAVKWLRPRARTADMPGGGGGGLVRYDSRSECVIFFNDIETDDKKSKWPTSVQEILKGGRNRNLWIKRNLFTAVAIVDPGTPAGLFTLSMMYSYIANGAPSRLGVVLVSGGMEGAEKWWDEWAREAAEGGVDSTCAADGDGGSAGETGEGDIDAAESAARRLRLAEGRRDESYLISKAMLYLTKKLSPTAALRFARDVHQSCAVAQRGGRRQSGDAFDGVDMRATATKPAIEAAFMQVCAAEGVKKCASKWEKLQVSTKFEAQLDQNEEFAQSLGVTEAPTIFVNGVPWFGSEYGGEVARQMSTAMLNQFAELQYAVRRGTVADTTDDIHAALLEQPGTRRRLAPSLADPAAVGLRPVWFPSLQSRHAVRYLGATRANIGAGACLRFEQTAGCKADGEREAGGDASCPHVIDSGRSGRCVCSWDKENGEPETVVHWDCGHPAISCASACARLEVATVSSWAFVNPAQLNGRRLLAAVLRRQLLPQPSAPSAAPARWAVLVLHDPDESQSSFFAGAIRALVDCASEPSEQTGSSSAKIAQDTLRALLLIVAGLIRRPDFIPATVSDLIEGLPDDSIKAVDACVLKSHGSSTSLQDRLARDRTLAAEAGVALHENALLVNGRWTVPEAPLLAEDLISLEEDSFAAHVSHALSSLEQHAKWKEWVTERGSAFVSDKLVAVASILPDPVAQRSLMPAFDSDGHQTILAGSDNALVTIQAVVNPLSIEAHEAATAAAAVLEAMGDAPVHIKFLMRPDTGIGRLPLDRWYKYLLSSGPRFDGDGALVSEAVEFRRLPGNPLLTLGLHSPAAWLCGLNESAVDLDNLVFNKIDSQEVQVLLQLEHILVEGNAGFDSAGTQLLLHSGGPRPSMSDTVAMANWNYFQLKASPGIWYLQTAGKSHAARIVGAANVYEVPLDAESRGWWGSAWLSGNDARARSYNVQELVLDSFRGVHSDFRVERHKATPARLAPKHLRHALQSSAAPELDAGKAKQADETVHIFSLASGILYERLLKVMVMGVRAHTKRPLKFWFLSNFASPDFKEFMPRMADELGFEFQFVTYSWPHWLHRQTEKQRVLWSYKILFLDVLFPIDVKRIIFLDADLVVRSDVAELWDMDLRGAPYAYTPFCQQNAREDTDGFRFWKQAWWQSHLDGKPYHISALFVVDLEAFRRLRAGDRLRSTYADLSTDENSLANLDQDLPNYAQHSIPIFSLPQEWLWCESWCTNASKTAAKAIE